MREKSLEAVRLLNSFIGDLIAGVRIMDLPDNVPGLTSATANSIRRMCLSHLVLTIYKLEEFYKKYKRVLPEEAKEVWKRLYIEIKRRGIRSFRNEYVGHIWTKNGKRPLLPDEIDTALESIFDSTTGEFLLWINNPDNNHIGESIVGTVEDTRDLIMKRENIPDLGYDKSQ